MAESKDELVRLALQSSEGQATLLESIRVAALDALVHKEDAVEEEDFDRAWALRRRSILEQLGGKLLLGDVDFALVERVKDDLIAEYRALLGF